MKKAKIQWLGQRVFVFDEETGRDLFRIAISNRNIIPLIRQKARDLGYEVPQIHAGKDGKIRIWL